MQHRTIRLPLSHEQADFTKRLYLAIYHAKLSWGASIQDAGPPDADYVRRMADRERVAISEWAAKLNKFN